MAATFECALNIAACQIPFCFAFLFGALAGTVRAEKVYPFAEDSKPHDGVPQGELLKFTFDRSKIFPGTTREVRCMCRANTIPPRRRACMSVRTASA